MDEGTDSIEREDLSPFMYVSGRHSAGDYEAKHGRIAVAMRILRDMSV